MPIVDGLTSAKMIRALELSTLAFERTSCVPIMAVSASLVEREKDTYVSAGFDGWILKPIDFKRLETLLRGIVDGNIRASSLYVTGEWERGGWFTRKAQPLQEIKLAETSEVSGPLVQETKQRSAALSEPPAVA